MGLHVLLLNRVLALGARHLEIRTSIVVLISVLHVRQLGTALESTVYSLVSACLDMVNVVADLHLLSITRTVGLRALRRQSIHHGHEKLGHRLVSNIRIASRVSTEYSILKHPGVVTRCTRNASFARLTQDRLVNKLLTHRAHEVLGHLPINLDSIHVFLDLLRRDLALLAEIIQVLILAHLVALTDDSLTLFHFLAWRHLNHHAVLLFLLNHSISIAAKCSRSFS